ncbi:MAG: NF038143 family protein [Candidatus Aerophobus sp.]|nr:MAG: NF038143 family protein [Candidatus Aerophobus sp.]
MTITSLGLRSIMDNSRFIWKHAVNQADRIARSLIGRNRAKFGWKTLFLFPLLGEHIRFRKTLNITRKNLLFTKRLALDAAQGIFRGNARAEEIRLIEIETKKLLQNENQGYYTEKVRRKQLHEIELLIDHYLDLLDSNKVQYSEMIKVTYKSAKNYLSFLEDLLKAEQEVIQATLSTMRKGSKKERFRWFSKIQEASRDVRIEEIQSIFPEA